MRNQTDGEGKPNLRNPNDVNNTENKKPRGKRVVISDDKEDKPSSLHQHRSNHGIVSNRHQNDVETGPPPPLHHNFRSSLTDIHDVKRVRGRRSSYSSESQSGPSVHLLFLGLILTVMLVLVVGLVAISIIAVSINKEKEPIDAYVNGTLPPTLAPTMGGTVDPPILQGTLREIYDRGFLRCGITLGRGRAYLNNTTNQMQGFSVDLCQAVAAAIFGTYPIALEIKILKPSGRFQALVSEEVDLLSSWDTHTMERDLMEPKTGAGFTFSSPYYYDGLAFGGLPFQSACVNADHPQRCFNVRVCAVAGTTYMSVIGELLPLAKVIATESFADIYPNFIEGKCNVMAGNHHDLAEWVVREAGYKGDYLVGSGVHSREPLALVTRDGDELWSDFVNWVMQSLLAAEEKGLTQFESLQSWEKTNLFGDPFHDMFVNALYTVGNYAELYKRHFESSNFLRLPINQLNNGTSGMIYSLPFGNTTKRGPEPSPTSTIAQILGRGYLRCGISSRVIFAMFNETLQEWSGFDVDFCRALSAALFNGSSTNVEFSEWNATQRFVALKDGEVDVLSRLTTVNLERDVLEPATKTGFSFSRPNFYDGLSFGGIPPYDQCADHGEVTTNECKELKICVNAGTTFHTILKTMFPSRAIVPKASGILVAEGLSAGDCNAIAGGVTDTSRTTVREVGKYDGEYRTGKRRFSKDPLALVTRHKDQQWSSFVFWTVSALFYAEEQNITAQTADQMPECNLYGPQFSQSFRHMVRAVGSYRDVYDRNAEAEVARSGPNLVNQYPFGPQHYSLPGLK